MASIYRRTRLKPIPAGAEIIERKGERVARWTDQRTGLRRRAPLNAAGNRIVVESPLYTVAYFDQNGERREVSSGTSDRDAAEMAGGETEKRSDAAHQGTG